MHCRLSDLSIGLLLAAGVVLALVGCGQVQFSPPAAVGAAGRAVPSIPAPPAPVSAREEPPAPRKAALPHNRRLTDAIGRGAAPTAAAGPDIQWLDVRHPSARQEPAPAGAVAADHLPKQGSETPGPVTSDTPGAALTSATILDAPAAALQQASYPDHAPTPPDEASPTSDRAALVAALTRQLRDSGDPELTKALNAAALSLLAPKRQLPPGTLDRLDRRQRQLVQQYQRMLVEVADQIASGTRAVDASAITDRIDDLFGDKALVIRQVKLCRRVDGYGVYEPFAGTKFVAKRDRRMVVYLELDNFKTVSTADEGYEVRLTQEIALYNDADGLEVWRLKQETIRDVSRNRRRDFYTVKMIQMPQWLGVGSYRLKVRMTDLNAGTQAESALALQFVADETLATSNGR